MADVKTTTESTRIYRILDFSKVVQIFEKKALYFANPSTWDDPYEQRIKHARSHALFAQCWCKLSISDAMWRIYSQNGLGVRISTTTTKLQAALQAYKEASTYTWIAKNVDYLSQADLNRRGAEIGEALRQRFKIRQAAEILFMKREAFRHESEWRAVVYCPGEAIKSPKRGILVPIDPHLLIDRILLDPRAPEELVSAFRFYFQEKLEFKKKVARSVLYKAPKPIEVDDERWL